MFPARTSTHASSSITPLSRIAAAVVTAGLFVGGMTACSTSGHQQIAAAAEAASSATRVTGARTLSFVATDIDGNSVTIDLGHKNPGEPDIGDLVAFTQDLAADGKNVGQVHVIAAVVDHTQHLSEATGTIVLKNGSIQLAGVVAMDPKFTLTVTGGTGDYVGATGTMDFDASGDAQTMTVRLR